MCSEHGISRRDFIKDAVATGVVTAVGTDIGANEAWAETVSKGGQADSTARCPYFDQPLFCVGQVRNGKLLCEE